MQDKEKGIKKERRRNEEKLKFEWRKGQKRRVRYKEQKIKGKKE